MDINKIQQQLIQALEQKNIDQVSTLSRVLNLIVGKSTPGEVLSTEPVTAAEQQKLQQQTSAALSQVREQIRNVAAKLDPKNRELDDRALSQDTKIPPVIRALFTRLLDQQEMLASNKLQWAEISQNGQKITIYTDQPLVAGQKIAIQLTNPQRLSFSVPSNQANASTAEDAPTAPAVKITSANTSLATSTNSKTIDELLKSTALNPLNKNEIKNPLSNTEISTDFTKQQSTIKNALALNRYTQLLIGDTAGESKIGRAQISQQTHLSSESVAAATDKLRDLLSLNARPSNLYSLITRITQESSPLFEGEETKSVEQILKAIASRIRSPDFFQRADAVKNSFRQSGIFYESRLNQFITNNQSSASPLSNMPGANNQSNKNTTNNFDMRNFNAPQNTIKLPENLINKLTHLVNSDTKGSLLNLIKINANTTDATKANSSGLNNTQENVNSGSDDLQNLIRELIKSSAASNTTAPNASFIAKSIGSDRNTIEQLNQLLEQLRNKDLPSATREKILNEVVKLIQQEAAHSLAKIQLQQFHSVLQSNDSELGGKHLAQSWQLELPVRHQNDVHPIQIDIERHWLEPDDAPEKNSETTKTKQWNITLRFDLPLMGEFCAQISMQGENLTAKLWAERENTLKRIRDALDNLKQQMESDGIVVKSLQCSNGLPAKKQIRLSYSLIDIST